MFKFSIIILSIIFLLVDFFLMPNNIFVVANERKEKLVGQENIANNKLKQQSSPKSFFARGRTRVYSGQYLEAIDFTIGGIGAGCIRLNGKAKPFVWQIFNNSTQAFVPHSFLALRVKPENGKPVVRVLQTEAVGPFTAMNDLEFRGEYPFAWYRFKDPNVPVVVTLEAFNPLIPLNTKDSAIPCAIFNLTAENKTNQQIEVSFLASQQNAVGYTGEGEIKSGIVHSGYGGNINKILCEKNATILHMTARQRKKARGYGDMALMVLTDDDESIVTATAQWGGSLDALLADFLADGQLSGQQEFGPWHVNVTINGAVATTCELEPGEKKKITFVLTWYFPNASYGHPVGWGDFGNMYTNFWTSAPDVGNYVASNLEELSLQSHLYHDALYSSNLPYWLLDRLSSQVVALKSQTTFWTKSGYFGGWEGCDQNTGCCYGNCNHVWHYAQAHARLFPDIARRMREQGFSFQSPEGVIPHRQPTGLPLSTVFFDGQCGDILASYRENLMSKNGKWLDKYWPNIKKAMDYMITMWDVDEDGILSGAQYTTLDCEISGSSSWLGSMYLAALAASEKMALLQNDSEAANNYRKIYQSGTKKQNESLFNGEYYFQIPDEPMKRDYASGCATDQLLGQWWANQLNLGWLYPNKRVQSAMQSVCKYNFKSDLQGIEQVPCKYVDDDDAGAQMITWPRGGRPEPPHCTIYADQIMSGFEYSTIGLMVQSGLLNEAFVMAKAISDRYDGRLRTGLASHPTWGYSGNPFGDDECGKFYARAMSVWSILLASQGYIYDGPAGIIGFKPVWKPENHKSFFTGAEGWGTFTQKRNGSKQIHQLNLEYGRLNLNQLIFELAQNTKPAKLTVKVGSKLIEADYAINDRSLMITLPSRVTLESGKVVTIEVEQ